MPVKAPTRRQLAATLEQAVPIVNAHTQHVTDLSQALKGIEDRVTALEQELAQQRKRSWWSSWP